MLRVNFSIRNNGHTDSISWTDGSVDGTFVGTVNGVRIHTAPGQPFILSLKGSKVPFGMYPRPPARVEPYDVHLDLQMLMEQLQRELQHEAPAAETEKNRKRKRAEAPAGGDGEAPKPKRQRTDEEKAATAAKTAATKAANKAAKEAAAAAAAATPPLIPPSQEDTTG
jgi:hypothetical protein